MTLAFFNHDKDAMAAHEATLQLQEHMNFRAHVSDYTGSKSDSYNLAAHSMHSNPDYGSYYADSDNARWKKNVEGLSKGLNHPGFALPHDTKAYTVVYQHDAMGKGVKINPRKHPLVGVRPGGLVTSPRFISSTAHEGNRDDWASMESRQTKIPIHLVTWHLPKGYNRGALVTKVSRHPDEHEFLMDHGQTFRKIGEDRRVAGGLLGFGGIHITVHHMEPVSKEGT